VLKAQVSSTLVIATNFIDSLTPEQLRQALHVMIRLPTQAANRTRELLPHRRSQRFDANLTDGVAKPIDDSIASPQCSRLQ